MILVDGIRRHRSGWWCHMVSDRSVEEVHAFASEMGLRLDSMMTITDAPELTEMLKRHQEETECHERRLRERLDALGAGTSTRKQAQTIATALMKGPPTRSAGIRLARTPTTTSPPRTWR